VNIEPKYYRVEYSKDGVYFPSIVKFREGDKYWICVSYNRDNPEYWTIKREVINPLLIEYGQPTYREVFEHALNKALVQIGHEYISSTSSGNQKRNSGTLLFQQ
jgi:hypothetical protein